MFQLRESSIYILAKGELTLSTVLPSSNKNQSKGYLCTKRPGDILDKHTLRRDAAKRVSPLYRLSFFLKKSLYFYV